MGQILDLNIEDKSLEKIWEKICMGTRLDFDDGVRLFGTGDLLGLGRMAHFVQRQLHGDGVYFVKNRQINPSNICSLSCRFCNFSVRNSDSLDAYSLSIDDILELLTPGINEVHITGSLNPDRNWEYYTNLIKSIRSSYKDVTIKAFTAVEIDYFSQKFGLSIDKIFTHLKQAGLDSMPGGGAEIFSPRVRKILCPGKISGERWLQIHRIAHTSGIPTNSTMLYGHVETVEERVEHLLALRSLQDETGGFLAFVPLSFQKGNTDISAHYSTPVDDLKMISVSRLLLDNIPHIKAYWIMLREEIASAALNFGADDIDGTIGEEKIAHAARAESEKSLNQKEIISLIKSAGKVPVQRNGIYKIVDIHHEQGIGKIPFLNAAPFYVAFQDAKLPLVSLVPSVMGKFQKIRRGIVAGPTSLADYLEAKDTLKRIPFCIGVRDRVRSVFLFSKLEIHELEEKSIGITDHTSTSVKLLEILLQEKYKLKNVSFQRLQGEDGDNHQLFDAVLHIGDNALKYNKNGLDGFPLIYDLGEEWYSWTRGLPFVFAVWTVSKTLDPKTVRALESLLEENLKIFKTEYDAIHHFHGQRLGLNFGETMEYLNGFNYKPGADEEKAIAVFEDYLRKQNRIRFLE